ncbi:putative arabinose efflux permease, MFS family|nr:putative arabinose efflux permease, MFS family [Candidatus Pantoea persica]
MALRVALSAFLSQIAAAAFAQFVWPIFGGAAIIGIALGILTRGFGRSNRRLALWAQALGVLAAVWLPGFAGLLIGALLVGGGFLLVVQLAGPMLSSISTALLHRLEPALWIAALGLAADGLLVWRRAS